jgi:hypothetical protein
MRLLRSSLTIALAGLAALPAAAGAIPNAPPRPVVGVPGGPHKLAAQGSYCWEGPNGGLCADTVDPMSYAPTLRLPAGGDPVIRMGYPAKRVFASAGEDDLDLEAVGDRRRKYLLHLPADVPTGPLGVYISASYDRGDGLFAIKIVARGR